MDKKTLKENLIKLVKEKSLITGVERVLTSGRTSNYYIDAKMTIPLDSLEIKKIY